MAPWTFAGVQPPQPPPSQQPALFPSQQQQFTPAFEQGPPPPGASAPAPGGPGFYPPVPPGSFRSTPAPAFITGSQYYAPNRQQQDVESGVGGVPAAGLPPFVPPKDADAATAYAFADSVVRAGFVRKVLSIVFLQLAFTVAVSAALLFVPRVRAYMSGPGAWLFYLAWGLSMVLIITLTCSSSARRRWPLNAWLLVAFTACEALLVGTITSYYDTRVVFLAAAATCAAVGALAAFATLQRRFDITGRGGILSALTMTLLLLVLIGIFWHGRIFHLVIAGCVAVLFSLYLVYDLQLLMGGHSLAISPDEWVMASLSIYLDIIQIFLSLLQIFGMFSDNN